MNNPKNTQLKNKAKQLMCEIQDSPNMTDNEFFNLLINELEELNRLKQTKKNGVFSIIGNLFTNSR